jgi:hypothetical protein
MKLKKMNSKIKAEKYIIDKALQNILFSLILSALENLIDDIIQYKELTQSNIGKIDNNFLIKLCFLLCWLFFFIKKLFINNKFNKKPIIDIIRNKIGEISYMEYPIKVLQSIKLFVLLLFFESFEL